MTTSLPQDFLLDPEATYLNHGGFGACPKPVFEVYQEWQRKLEWNPTCFVRNTPDYLQTSRAALGAYLNTDANNLVYYQNPTIAANMIMRSLDLQPGDEILTSNYEYGAMNNAWEFYCKKTGAKYVHQTFPLPVDDPDAFVDALFAGVTPRTKVIFFSQITSPTAMIYPTEAICRRAREANIITFIDGAHALSQIPVDIDALDCDYYVGACHKWLCAPKGSAFAYAHPRNHDKLNPLAISMGWLGCINNPVPEGKSSLVHYQEYQGTRDVAAFLSVPAAIQYQQEHDWEAQRQRCHALAVETQRRICALTGMEPFSPHSGEFFGQFVSVPLPKGEWEPLHEKLLAQKIIVPLFPLEQMDCNCIRISYQAYNDERDMETLLAVLTEEYKKEILEPVNAYA